MSTKSWYRDVSHMLDDLGIAYEFQTGKKHTKVWLQKGEKKGLMVISASPSSRRSLDNAKSLAKKLVW